VEVADEPPEIGPGGKALSPSTTEFYPRQTSFVGYNLSEDSVCASPDILRSAGRASSSVGQSLTRTRPRDATPANLQVAMPNQELDRRCASSDFRLRFGPAEPFRPNLIGFAKMFAGPGRFGASSVSHNFSAEARADPYSA